jgi:multiple sugar transport system ATP-binding protein
MNFMQGALTRENGALVFNGEALKLELPPKIADAVGGYSGRQVDLGIRPEDIHDARFAGEGQSRNLITLHTEVVEPLGAETLVYLRGGSSGSDIVAKFDSRSTPRVGEDLEVAFDCNMAHIFDPESGESLTRQVE